MPKRSKLANNGRLFEPRLFTVEGTGVFPFDMLRYDSCWPYREGRDSARLSGHYDSERRRVCLKTYHSTAPTLGRWESFGWRVLALDELAEAMADRPVESAPA